MLAGLQKRSYLDYENIVETMNSKSDLFLQSNPVLKKSQFSFMEIKPFVNQQIIVEYIDEVWKNNGTPSILPSNAYDRAIAKFWIPVYGSLFSLGWRKM
ncbi:glutathione S-transferase tau, putative [Medicago truncatula]|uniref:Glutathione S-transferase n=1 Tax=Medicago truncatula TaxID=3880 RepID=G7K8A7_MEDTR|nr:glutathione S-transferase tau, putative [Medicago truncatula]